MVTAERQRGSLDPAPEQAAAEVAMEPAQGVEVNRMLVDPAVLGQRSTTECAQSEEGSLIDVASVESTSAMLCGGRCYFAVGAVPFFLLISTPPSSSGGTRWPCAHRISTLASAPQFRWVNRSRLSPARCRRPPHSNIDHTTGMSSVPASVSTYSSRTRCPPARGRAAWSAGQRQRVR